MEAQKLSKKSGSQNGSPKTFQKEIPKWKPKNLRKKVDPKMKAQKLSKKRSQNGSPKTFQKKWFPNWKPDRFRVRFLLKQARRTITFGRLMHASEWISTC